MIGIEDRPPCSTDQLGPDDVNRREELGDDGDFGECEMAEGI